MTVCSRCGREGPRGFEGDPPRCASQSACEGRILEERNRHTVARTDRGNSHSYRLDGEHVQGVTTLIKEGLPTPALVGWGINKVARYGADHLEELWGMRNMGPEAIYESLRQAPYTERNSAGVRGTLLHTWAEKLMRREKVEVPRTLMPWVQSMIDYLDDFKPQSVLSECAVASRRWRYAGTLDDVSDFPDGERRVVDYKSGNRIYSDVALQLAAYRNAEIYRVGSEPERRMADLGISEEGYAVHIRPEGYEVHPVYVGEEAFQAFNRVAWVARLRANNGPLDSWLNGPLPHPHKEGTSE